ncbi:MAG: glycoside hydrolase family 2 protein [Bacteroidetes bacterium]|nr:glycoside hydrolase family 2 protein [Bacteroidota bacterium]
MFKVQGSKFLWSILFLLIYTTSCSDKAKDKLPIVLGLNDNWQYRQADKSDWKPAVVPGTVHMAEQLSSEQDPFKLDNESAWQWIENEDWEYQIQFVVGKDIRSKEVVELHFEGLDTYSEIFLNGSLLLSTNNMFRTWVVDCKEFLISDTNRLRIYFHSPVQRAKELYAELDYELPEGSRAMTRKAAFQYGWDFGPRFVTSGIWRPVILKAWDKATITDLHIIQNEVLHENATLTAVFEIESTGELDVDVSISSAEIFTNDSFHLEEGTNECRLNFEIENPNLWWPNGLGEAFLYHFKGKIKIGERLIDSVSQKTGIRTIELISMKDSLGSNFYFLVNGEKVFMKGANYIPQNILSLDVSGEQYEKLISDVKEANMNMLRVWGGGIYENDKFYKLCDRKGILVWQDFMFANNMYPGDKNFLHNIKMEAIDNIKRLRNHPCIALWCGNNEIDEAWHNWGWQDEHSEDQKEELWNNYTSIFHELLPQLVMEYADSSAYWSSSPKYGRGDSRSQYEGDSHYWGVWHDAEPFKNYEIKVPRFMSEFGFQSFPGPSTLKMYMSSEDGTIDAEMLKAHQKHSRGFGLIDEYMDRSYLPTGDFTSKRYVSQLLQAEGIKLAIEAHRRAKPNCMGSLYWQLNDCWPAISWSSIDYTGQWKALHYFVKKAFEEVSVSAVYDGKKLVTYVISDKLIQTKGTLSLKLWDITGNIVEEISAEIEISGNGFIRHHDEVINKALLKYDLRWHVLEMMVEEGGVLIAQNIKYFHPPAGMYIPAPQLNIITVEVDSGYLIQISTDVLAKNVYLSIEAEGRFTDNYFDILPKQTVQIIFETEDEVDQFLDKLEIIILSDTNVQYGSVTQYTDY